ncbi:DNA-3-methyladenine glycosylase [Treponema pedis]|uniref:DNA-3-methyladenine glycosylase n=1 Tax=Treponema pedis TaxID=409322 RepID=UPI000407D1C0|nr:DNA-3-methyladenine glycosylase [Treponema pedis]QSI05551.1 DNA-3-methyladenine glycosylase [Treponema pedis]
MKEADFFNLQTEELAKALLGKLLLIKTENGIAGGYIVETEAYLGVTDRACHSFGGKRTPKVEAMYSQAGTIYIYTIHTHKMLNIVSCGKDNPQAVLIRAIEPVLGIPQMEKNRGTKGTVLTNGPGKLTKAMGITSIHNMMKMQQSELYIDFKNSKTPKKIKSSPRIGIPDKGIWTLKNLRFFVNGNKFVSGMKKNDYDNFPWL